MYACKHRKCCKTNHKRLTSRRVEPGVHTEKKQGNMLLGNPTDFEADNVELIQL